MEAIVITAKCAQGHSQTLGIGPGLDFVWARHLAGLMDGTSDFYVNSPRGDASSLIGKCGIAAHRSTAPLRRRRIWMSGSPVWKETISGTGDWGQALNRIRILSANGRSWLNEWSRPLVAWRQLTAASAFLVMARPLRRITGILDPATGQQKGYVVLTEEERGKGFVRPVRKTYIHVGLNPKMSGHVLIKPGENGCGSRTTMGLSIAETYARDPGFYSGTFCCSCSAHRPLNEFVWEGTADLVGS